MLQRRCMAVTIGLALFIALLSCLVASGVTQGFDTTLRSQLLLRDPAGAFAFWHATSYLGSGLVITALTIVCVVFLTVSGHRLCAQRLALVMLCAVICENLVKWVLHRARPPQVFPGTMPGSYSFPSGHTLFASAFYVTVALMVSAGAATPLTKGLVWMSSVTLVVLIGASRIFLGVHYPLDVLGGFAAAMFCISLICVTQRPSAQ